MGAHKHSGKSGGGGGYVGGLLHLFDWNAKSRKKLFSSKSESPEQPKQTKRTNGNTPMTRYQTMYDDDVAHGSSCGTSVTDEDGYGSKAPGVVARLMGLDSLPNSNFSDTYSNPSNDSRSLRDVEFEPNYHQIETRFRLTKPKQPIEKFRTEMLPPKSAKSIPITRNNLLSPIKNSGFVSSSNPDRIMEAASKIPIVGSSLSIPSPSCSVPLKVRACEKIDNSKKPKLPEASRRPVESNSIKNLKPNQQSTEPKKSISLALQAKANVQKRVKTQPNPDRNLQKNPSVLKPNNQKQNMLVDRGTGKSTPKSSSSIANSKKPVSSKIKSSENSKTSHKKEPYSTTRRKRSIEENNNNNNNNNVIRDPSYRSNKSDVVSFTFTAPISRGKNATGNSSPLSSNVIGSDALSTLLEQKLRELTGNPASVSRDDSSYGFSWNDHVELTKKHQKLDDQGHDRNTRDDSSYGFSSNDRHKVDMVVEPASECSSGDYEYRKYLRGREPSPISVLEPSFFTESCNSSDTANSYKQQTSSSIQAQASPKPSPMDIDIDTELSDSASSKWEPDYVNEILSDIEKMFDDFTLGKTRKIVNPRVFDRLEHGAPKHEVAKLRRELVFDCVSEGVDQRCRVWTKGLAIVSRPDRLGQEVYKEIVGLENMKDGMVDELVDKDMSGYGNWLDFGVETLDIGVEIEGRLIDALIDEIVDDILAV